MKSPLSWLKDYVDIDCSPEELQAAREKHKTNATKRAKNRLNN